MNQSTKLRSCFNLATLAALVWMLAGCMHTSPRSAEVRGRVLDAKTHLPIKGAMVRFCDPPYHTIYTDAGGYFLMKATKNFHWPAGADSSGYPPPKSDGIRITHENYKLDEFWPGYDEDMTTR